MHFQLAYADCNTKAPFDIVINYSGGGETSITVSTPDLIKDFTIFETRRDILLNEDIFVGSFEVEIHAVTLDSFTVRTFTFDQYVADINNFIAFSNQSGGSNCRLLVFSNTNPAGDEISTQLFNNSTLISFNPESGSFLRKSTITVYLAKGQLEDIEGSTCQMPIIFQIEGL